MVAARPASKQPHGFGIEASPDRFNQRPDLLRYPNDRPVLYHRQMIGTQPGRNNMHGYVECLVQAAAIASAWPRAFSRRVSRWIDLISVASSASAAGSPSSRSISQL